MPRPRADGKKPIVRRRGPINNQWLSGSCRTFKDLPDNVTQTILKMLDPVEYNILRTGNWPVQKMVKTLAKVLNNKDDGTILPTLHVPSLIDACLGEYHRRPGRTTLFV
jgi:hypothetical protein